MMETLREYEFHLTKVLDPHPCAGEWIALLRQVRDPKTELVYGECELPALDDNTPGDVVLIPLELLRSKGR